MRSTKFTMRCTAKLKSSFNAEYKQISGAARWTRESICREAPESGATNSAAFKLMTTIAKENTMKLFQWKGEYLKKILIAIFEVIVLLIVFDLIILFTSLAQIALEGRTGYWNPFWRVQAEFVVKLLLTK